MDKATVTVTLRRPGSPPKKVTVDWTPELHVRGELLDYPGWTIFKIEFTQAA